MPTAVRAEWKKSHEFHEIAETLRIPTELVMAGLAVGNGSWTVLYTHPGDEELVWVAILQRDADGILMVCGEPVPQPGMWENIKAQLEEQLGDA